MSHGRRMRLFERVLLVLAPRLLLRRRPADTRLLGDAGERCAARHLERAGWRILARRLPTRHGELDLVGIDGRTLVAVEVKTGRRGPRFRPGHRVRREDLERLGRAARHLAARLGLPDHRVDLVEVILTERAPAGVSLVHLRGVESPLD